MSAVSTSRLSLSKKVSNEVHVTKIKQSKDWIELQQPYDKFIKELLFWSLGSWREKILQTLFTNILIVNRSKVSGEHWV